MRFFDNENFTIAPTNAEGGHTSLSEIEATLTLRTNPEIINFSEDFIRLIMNEEKTSLVLFTKNVNKDKIKPYYQEFKTVAHQLFDTKKSSLQEEKPLFVTSGANYGI